MVFDDPEGWDGIEGGLLRERGGMCIHKADSFHCTAEANTTSQHTYSPI